VHGWEIRSLTSKRLDAIITCGGGTYIRALARDLGRRCDSAAHLAALRRTRSGSFDVADATGVDGLRDGRVVARPALTAVSHLPIVAVDIDDVARVRQGRVLVADESVGAQTAALVDTNGALVAVAERVDSSWQPRVVLPEP
jgi:tRNA pseudouridine55 synthase